MWYFVGRMLFFCLVIRGGIKICLSNDLFLCWNKISVSLKNTILRFDTNVIVPKLEIFLMSTLQVLHHRLM